MREVELPLVEILVAMEREGLGLDTERLAAIGEGMEERIAELEAEIFAAAGKSSRSVRRSSSPRSCSSTSA